MMRSQAVKKLKVQLRGEELVAKTSFLLKGLSHLGRRGLATSPIDFEPRPYRGVISIVFLLLSLFVARLLTRASPCIELQKLSENYSRPALHISLVKQPPLV